LWDWSTSWGGLQTRLMISYSGQFLSRYHLVSFALAG
jgi:hypothetical protein